MYFVKVHTKIKVESVPDYSFLTTCSRGTLSLRPSIKFDRQTNKVKVRWMWTVAFDRSKVSDGPAYPSGVEITLRQAAIKGLQRLLSQHKQPLYKLMNLLVADQVMHELANLGR